MTSDCVLYIILSNQNLKECGMKKWLIALMGLFILSCQQQTKVNEAQQDNGEKNEIFKEDWQLYDGGFRQPSKSDWENSVFVAKVPYSTNYFFSPKYSGNYWNFNPNDENSKKMIEKNNLTFPDFPTFEANLVIQVFHPVKGSIDKTDWGVTTPFADADGEIEKIGIKINKVLGITKKDGVTVNDQGLLFYPNEWKFVTTESLKERILENNFSKMYSSNVSKLIIDISKAAQYFDSNSYYGIQIGEIMFYIKGKWYRFEFDYSLSGSSSCHSSGTNYMMVENLKPEDAKPQWSSVGRWNDGKENLIESLNIQKKSYENGFLYKYTLNMKEVDYDIKKIEISGKVYYDVFKDGYFFKQSMPLQLTNEKLLKNPGRDVLIYSDKDKNYMYNKNVVFYIHESENDFDKIVIGKVKINDSIVSEFRQAYFVQNTDFQNPNGYEYLMKR